MAKQSFSPEKESPCFWRLQDARRAFVDGGDIDGEDTAHGGLWFGKCFALLVLFAVVGVVGGAFELVGANPRRMKQKRHFGLSRLQVFQRLAEFDVAD